MVFRRVTPCLPPARNAMRRMFMPVLGIRSVARPRVTRHPRRPTTRRIVKTARRIAVHRVVVRIQGRVVGPWRLRQSHRPRMAVQGIAGMVMVAL